MENIIPYLYYISLCQTCEDKKLFFRKTEICYFVIQGGITFYCKIVHHFKQFLSAKTKSVSCRCTDFSFDVYLWMSFFWDNSQICCDKTKLTIFVRQNSSQDYSRSPNVSTLDLSATDLNRDINVGSSGVDCGRYLSISEDVLPTSSSCFSFHKKTRNFSHKTSWTHLFNEAYQMNSVHYP